MLRLLQEKLFVFTLVAVLCTVRLSSAQDNCEKIFSGQVLTEGQHLPVSFATIYFPELQTGTQSDEHGYFSIHIPCNLNLEVEIRQLEYQALTIQVKKGKEDLQQEIYLKQKDEHLSTVTVHAHKRDDILRSNVENVLTSKELKRLKGKSLSESVSTLPGVYNIKTGPGINKPMIHGLYGSRIQVVNNEVAQMGQQWGVDHAPEIDPFIASRITVVKGASAVKYGPRAIGGALLLEPEPLLPDSALHGSVDLVGFTNGRGGIGSGMLSGSILTNNTDESFNWRIQASGKKSGDQQAANYNLTNTGSQELNFSTAANYINENFQADVFYSRFQTEIGILRGAHIGNVDNFFEALERRPPFYTEPFSYEINNPRQEVVHHLLKTKIHHDWEEKGAIDFIYGFQQNNRREYDIRRSSDDNRASIDLQLASHVAKLHFLHDPVLDNLVGSIGIDYEYQNNRNVPGTGTKPLIPNYQSFQTGLFISESWIKTNWNIEAGLRYDRIFLDVLKFDADGNLINPTHSYDMFAAIAGGGYQFNRNLTFKGNLSWSERAPNINELYSQGLHHSVAAIEEGDQTLGSEQSAKILTSFQYKLTDRLKFNLDGHFSRINNYIYLQPKEPRLTIRGAFPVYQYQQTLATISGFDAIGSYELFHHFSVNSKASVIRGNDLDNDLPLIFIPADRWENTLKWRLANKWDFKEIEFNLTGLQVFKQTRAPITETEAYEEATVPVPEAYFITNFSIDTEKQLKNAQLNIGVSIYNVLNRDYTDYLNRLRFYAGETGRNIELRINYIF
ncbi:TonB-dependent receptor [Marivirga sp. S37H4]|uniref:TonB-dependent receptor n=1 Tax=Marivirga aurantiaca TaxID=2802615 RepID=A0A934WZC1_9BACT|nr:TonB-dependent receptor [Marivirga aurantiaca]MBK6265561.1 TonB-dependent receptor [Marivirga aurantiaca]